MIRKLIEANVYLVKHTVLIPLKLLFIITVYIPFIKLPVLWPARHILELEPDWYADKLMLWLGGQVELFIISIVHFVMVNVFLGVIVGVLTGFNLKAIRYVLTWKPKEKKRKQKRTPRWARDSRQFVLDLALLHVVVEPPNAKRTPLIEDLGLSQLPLTKSTVLLLLQPFGPTNTMRQRQSLPLLPSSANSTGLYDDDDGYQAYTIPLELPLLTQTRRSSLQNIEEEGAEEDDAEEELPKKERAVISLEQTS